MTLVEKGNHAGAEFELECVRHDLETKAYAGNQFPGRHDILGPKMGNYHLLMKQILDAFDPNNLSNPTRPMAKG